MERNLSYKPRPILGRLIILSAALILIALLIGFCVMHPMFLVDLFRLSVWFILPGAIMDYRLSGSLPKVISILLIALCLWSIGADFFQVRTDEQIEAEQVEKDEQIRLVP